MNKVPEKRLDRDWVDRVSNLKAMRFIRVVEPIGFLLAAVAFAFGVYVFYDERQDRIADRQIRRHVLTSLVADAWARVETAKGSVTIRGQVRALETLHQVGESMMGIDLEGTNLVGLQLPGADFIIANLSGAHLRKANLSGALFFRANLSKADLTGADLSDANLMEANLSGVNFRGADLSGTILWRANLEKADLEGANLSRAALAGAFLQRTNLTGANFSGADLSRGGFEVEGKWGRAFSPNLGAADFRLARGLTRPQLESACVGDAKQQPQLPKELADVRLVSCRKN